SPRAICSSASFLVRLPHSASARAASRAARALVSTRVLISPAIVPFFVKRGSDRRSPSRLPQRGPATPSYGRSKEFAPLRRLRPVRELTPLPRAPAQARSFV